MPCYFFMYLEIGKRPVASVSTVMYSSFKKFSNCISSALYGFDFVIFNLPLLKSINNMNFTK